MEVDHLQFGGASIAPAIPEPETYALLLPGSAASLPPRAAG